MREVKTRNNFSKRSSDLKPRELMERAENPSSVSDEALLAVLLKTGACGLDVVNLARRLLYAFGSLKSLLSSDWRTIENKIKDYNEANPSKKIRGIGHVKCLELAAAFELGRRWERLSPEEIRQIKVVDSESAYRVFKAMLNPADENENLLVLLLDSACRPLCEPIKTIRGNENSAVFSPKIIFKEAIRWGATAIIVAHNHPCGIVEPSTDDLNVTRDMVAIGGVVGIPLIDHLVIGDMFSNNGADFLSIRDTHPEIFTY